MSKVFLGGTVRSAWRERLIQMIVIDYYNPIVKDWTPECIEEENKEKKSCDLELYVFTPQMNGIYAIAEVVDASNKKPKDTIMCVLFDYDSHSFSEEDQRSIKEVIKMVEGNGSEVFYKLWEVARCLNGK